MNTDVILTQSHTFRPAAANSHYLTLLYLITEHSSQLDTYSQYRMEADPKASVFDEFGLSVCLIDCLIGGLVQL